MVNSNEPKKLQLKAQAIGCQGENIKSESRSRAASETRATTWLSTCVERAQDQTCETIEPKFEAKVHGVLVSSFGPRSVGTG